MLSTRSELDTTREGALRRELDATAAVYRSQSKTADHNQDYTYLSSPEPGTYVRFTQLGNRLLYVEHLDMPLGSVTFSGEVRVVLGS